MADDSESDNGDIDSDPATVAERDCLSYPLSSTHRAWARLGRETLAR